MLSISLSIILAWILTSNQVIQFFVSEAINQNKEISTSITSYIENKLNESVMILETIDKGLSAQDLSIADSNQLITDINSVANLFSDIEILNENGQVVYTLKQYDYEIGYDRSREPFYTILTQDMDVYWSSEQLSPYSTGRTIPIVIPGQSGYIVGYLDLAKIQVITKNYISNLGSLITGTITDDHGIYLVNENENLVEERRLDPHFEIYRTIILEDKDYIHQDSTQESMLITAQEIVSTGWIVSISEPYKNAVSGIYEIVELLIWFIIIEIIAFSFLLLIGNNRVIDDIKHFTLKISNVANGITSKKSSSYFKEFEPLENSFNVMVDKINERDLRLKEIAYHDALTGFYNRTYLDEVYFENLSYSNRGYAVIYIDLDNFSYVNDTYGHDVGDLLLIEFGKMLNHICESNIDIIRLGGDEFILILTEENILEVETQKIIKDLLEMSKEPILFNDRAIYFTLSAGVSFYPKDGSDFWTLLKNADMAMYSAKAEGKNTIVFFKNKMNLLIEKHLSIEQHLRTAFQNNEFTLVFQPQISVDENVVRGFEALVRWNSLTLGVVNPIDFIHVAEDNKMIIPLGQWIINTACEKIKIINDEFHTEYIMAVNCSPVELKEADFAQNILKIVRNSGINPAWLEIEITENISIDVFTKISENLKILSNYGIGISIDDFGTGYSSLAYLQKIPLDVLKVDRLFITGIDDQNARNLMTETIFLMANKLGLKTIAEGVETQQELDYLKTLKCDYLQGFLFSKPLKYDDLLVYIKSKKIRNLT